LSNKLEQNVIERTNELKESEEKYRILFESSKDGIVYSNMEGGIIDCNQAFLDILGYNLAEIKEFSYQQLTPEKWHKIEEDIFINQSLPRGHTDEFEKEYIRKDGTTIPISITAWLIKDDQGNNKGMWGIVKDITERKKADQKLKESEEKFRMLFNNINDAIVIVNMEGKVIECNQTSYERLGYTKEEFLNMTPMDIDTPEYAEGVLDRIKVVIQEGSSSYEVDHKRKDGMIIPVEINSKKINFQGKTAILSVVRDITVRKKAENKLKDSEAKYRSIIDNSGSGIVVLDKNGFYEIVNKQAAETLGGKPEDFIQKSLFDLFSRDIAEEYIKNNKKIIEIGTGRQYERTFDLPKGTRTFLINEQVVNDSAGRGLFLTSSSVDITERKLIEQRLKESEVKYRSIIV
ncbi:hypothetical protein LCGC14_1580490, partial [marine sediment metagenome]